MQLKNVFRSLKQSFFLKQDPVEAADVRLVLSLAKSRIPSLRQLAYVSNFFTGAERKSVRVLLGVGGFCVLLLLGSFIIQGSGKPAYGGTYTEGLIGYPDHINPVLAAQHSSEDVITSLVYRKLFTFDANGKLQPDLVESYELLENGKQYHLRLRSNVVWQDGEPFDADDVLYTFGAIQEREYLSPLFSRFASVKLDKTGDFDIVYTLPEASRWFLSSLAIGILPEHVWSSTIPQAFALSSFNQRPVGNGPFRFARLTKNQDGLLHSYELVRNESFNGTKPYIDQIVFKFYSTYEDAENALIKGNIDGLGGIPKKDRNKLVDSGRVRVHDVDSSEFVALFVNVKGSVPLRSREMRSALSLAVARDDIVSSDIGGSGYSIAAPFLRGFVGYDPSLRIDYQVDAANQALDKLGWKLEGGVRKKDAVEFKFTITIVGSNELIAVAESLKKQFEKIGILVDIVVFDTESAAREAIRSRQYDALLAKVNVGPSGDLFPLFHSSQAQRGVNFSQYANRDFDLAVERARVGADSVDASKQHTEMQTILLKDVPTIFLYSPAYTFAQAKRVQGFQSVLMIGAESRFASLAEWFVKEKVF